MLLNLSSSLASTTTKSSQVLRCKYQELQQLDSCSQDSISYNAVWIFSSFQAKLAWLASTSIRNYGRDDVLNDVDAVHSLNTLVTAGLVLTKLCHKCIGYNASTSTRENKCGRGQCGSFTVFQAKLDRFASTSTRNYGRDGVPKDVDVVHWLTVHLHHHRVDARVRSTWSCDVKDKRSPKFRSFCRKWIASSLPN